MNRLQQMGSRLLTAALLLTGSTCALTDTAAGRVIYNGKGVCASCHGLTGKGDGPAAAALNPKPQDITTGNFNLDTDGDGQKGTASDLYNVIRYGAPKYGGAATMPGRPDLSEQEIKDLVAFTQSLIL